MSDDKSQQDPSMEEILSSIRRIISEDNEPVAPETKKQAEAGDSDADGQVLELTQMVREDGTTIDISEEPVQSDDDKAKPKATGADKPKESPPADEGPLVGDDAADASVKALSELNRAAEAAEPKLVSPAIGDQGRTIEDMVMESLKPMLRDWLDTNLPILVERLVEKEIRRLVRRAEPE